MPGCVIEPTRCRTTACGKHPGHDGLSNKPTVQVHCYVIGSAGVKPQRDGTKIDVWKGEATVIAPCANYTPCSGCPTCKPLPEWATRSMQGVDVAAAILEIALEATKE
jgi:hypothetical protein